MAVDLQSLLDPAHTAVLTMELQVGVVGDAARIPALAQEVADQQVVERAAAVVRAARDVGARVVHCTVAFRADGAGSRDNSPLMRMLAKGGPHPLVGSPAAAVMPELGPEATDLMSTRSHGLTPFPGTDLDALLRNLGVRTVVATGVSLNVGVVGLVTGAVDHGYDAVVATDAVAGVPRDYGALVLEHTLAVLATRLTSDEIVETWSQLRQS
jgi:nicotinamidase-related amidase